MRVIAGSVGGRRLMAPRGAATRPTVDRVKEAVFSSLAPYLHEVAVLDLYAGSGALAIEALSRGAASATIIESAGPALEAIRTNLEATGLADRATVIQGRLPGALDRVVGLHQVVLIDPPYDLDEDELEAMLAAAARHAAPGARWRLERSARGVAPRWPTSVEVGRVRRYGAVAIHEATSQDDR